MEILLLTLLVPFVVAWICKFVWSKDITWLELGATLVISLAVTGGTYWAGMYAQTADTEIINGEVLSKDRVHGEYTRTYSCNCSTDSKGNQTCQTCSEEHYTVTWTCRSNVGDIRIDQLDSTWPSVYNKPDPNRYTTINKGDPVAQEHHFTNYVKAVPDSLFHQNAVNKFQAMIPTYPNKVFDYYNLNRALAIGVQVPDLAAWNNDISDMLRKLGPQKQANVVVLFVNTADEGYIHALEGAWIGGKKNDIIVVMGVTQYPKIDWVAVSSWTDKALFKVQLRDDINAIGTVDREKIIAAIDKNTMTTFKRKNMKDYEYLKNRIQPATWVLTLAVLLGILVSAGASFYFYRNDPFGGGRSRY